MRYLNEQQFCGWCAANVSYPAKWISVCSSCNFKRYINPNPCSNVIVARNSEVLMVKRAIEPGYGQYDLPGGYMEISDGSMEDCVYREMEEETGIGREAVTSLRYFGSAKAPDYVWQNTAIKNVSFFFVARLRDPEFRLRLDGENSELRWINQKDLQNIDFAWDIDKQMLTRYFEERQ